MPNLSTDRPLIIASRGSALALTQSHHVKDRFQALVPDLEVKIQIFKTEGDKLQSKAPHEIPDKLPKGLFTKELERALLENEADLAVHSLKDLPTVLPDGLKLAAVSPREDVREVLLTKEPLELAPNQENPLAALKDGARIGTGSPRRQAFLHLAKASLQSEGIRGNVATRIRKLAEQESLDGIILAAAGLRRLGYHLEDGKLLSGEDLPDSIFATILPISAMVPSVGQAALGLETRSDDPWIQGFCDQFNDSETQLCVEVERAFLEAMGGGCLAPVAAVATIREGVLKIVAANVADQQCRLETVETAPENGVSLARELADKLRN